MTEVENRGQLGVVGCAECSTRTKLIRCGQCEGYYCNPHFFPHILTAEHQKVVQK